MCFTLIHSGLFFNNLFLLFILGCNGDFVAEHGFSLVTASRGHSRCSVRASHLDGPSCCGAQDLHTWASTAAAHRLQELWLTGSRVWAQQLCPTACRIFLAQG